MSIRRYALFLLIASAGCAGVAATGSNGGDDASTSGTPTATGTSSPVLYGGYVSMGTARIETAGTPVDSRSASAAFFDPYTLGAYPTPAVNTCTVSTPAATPTPVTPVSRDAGATLSLSGPSSIELDATMNAAYEYYAPPTGADVSAIAPGSTWSISWAGGTGVGAANFASALTVPAAMLLTSPDPSQVITLSGSDLAVSWTGNGSTPAEIMITVVASASDWASIVCSVDDDGGFVVPASAIAALPSGSGSLVVYRTAYTSKVLGDGSTIYLSGYAEHAARVAK